jgi:hypothetical protein
VEHDVVDRDAAVGVLRLRRSASVTAASHTRKWGNRNQVKKGERDSRFK